MAETAIGIIRKVIIKLMVPLAILSLFLLISVTSCDLLDFQTGLEGELSAEEKAETGEGDLESKNMITTHITLWDYIEPRERITLINSVENFMAENEHINMETRHFRNREELEDQFEAASLAGSGPELLLIDFDGVHRLAPGNVLKEISDEENEFDYSSILNGLVEISEYSGRKYIIPFRSLDFLVFLYNRDLINDPPRSFDEVIEYCSSVNDFTRQTYGFLMDASEPDWVIPFIGGYSGWIVDYNTDSLALDIEAVEKALEFLNYIYNEERILPSGMEYGEISDLFKSGNAHMIIDNVNSIEEYQEEGLNVGVSKIPLVYQGDEYPTPLISGLGFMINVNCYGNELEALNEFITYMLSEEVQLDWNSTTQTLPVLKSLASSAVVRNDDIVNGAFQQAELCRGKPYEKLIMVIRDAIRDNVKNVISGDILPEDAALKIQEDALRLRSEEILIEKTGGPSEADEAGEGE